MTSRQIFLGVAALVLASVTPVLAQQPSAAGRIKVVSGSAFVFRDGRLVSAQAGQDVYASDRLRTGADGRIGVTLKDDTRLSLGPSSEVAIERFAYATADGSLGLVLKFVRGV